MLLSELDNQNSLEDSILGNEIIHGGETKFTKFVDAMSDEMNNNVSVHARRHDANLCSSRWTSIRHMLEDVKT